MSRELKQLYFSHDFDTRSDNKIMKLIYKHGMAGYGIFWAIVEYMHRNKFVQEDEKMFCYNLRIDEQTLHSILTEFDLFN